MAQNNNNNSQQSVSQADVEKSLAAVENLLNNLESGDATAAKSLQYAVQESCQILAMAANPDSDIRLTLDKEIVLTLLKSLLKRIDVMHNDLKGQLVELQELMSTTNNSSVAAKAYLKTSNNIAPIRKNDE